MKTHPPSLYTADNAFEGKKEKENQQTDFYCHLLLFEKMAQPNKHFGKAVSAPFQSYLTKHAELQRSMIIPINGNTHITSGIGVLTF